MAKTRCVFLIGFMGAGKTTVGKVLAHRLGWKFYDLDQLIEKRERQTIATIFEKAGEKGFRKIESAVLTELLDTKLSRNAVVALGGGTFVQPENRQALQRAEAITVLLSAPVEELSRRCEAGGNARPLAGDRMKFDQLFASRQEAYGLAQFRVDTAGKDVRDVAQEIERILEKQ
ncbi:MAG TPA: shikimate kinase [Candidatus Angelobacter sp.]